MISSNIKLRNSFFLASNRISSLVYLTAARAFEELPADWKNFFHRRHLVKMREICDSIIQHFVAVMPPSRGWRPGALRAFSSLWQTFAWKANLSWRCCCCYSFLQPPWLVENTLGTTPRERTSGAVPSLGCHRRTREPRRGFHFWFVHPSRQSSQRRGCKRDPERRNLSNQWPIWGAWWLPRSTTSPTASSPRARHRWRRPGCRTAVFGLAEGFWRRSPAKVGDKRKAEGKRSLSAHTKWSTGRLVCFIPQSPFECWLPKYLTWNERGKNKNTSQEISALTFCRHIALWKRRKSN